MTGDQSGDNGRPVATPGADGLVATAEKAAPAEVSS
jgi:hypothetical protein